MNLTNPFQTIRGEDRRDVQGQTLKAASACVHRVLRFLPPNELKKTKEKTREIIAGTDLERVFDEAAKEAIPPIEIVRGYRDDVLDAAHRLACLITGDGHRVLRDISDEDLACLALAAEAMAQGARNYLRMKEAGIGCQVSGVS